jgi:methionine-gamma-lyase
VTGFSTRAIRAATRAPRVSQRPTSVPIYQTATFSSADAEELGAVLTDRVGGYAYGRLGNPTAQALGAAVAELEGGEAGFALGSGMAAIHATILSLVGPDRGVVATRAIYGSTRTLLVRRFAALGVPVDFVDPTDLDAVDRSLRTPRAAVLYVETIANPTIVVADIAALAGIAHRRGARLVVDNTFASPYLCRPLELGADLVVESATKYLSGHSDALAGVVAGPAALVEAVRQAEIDTGAALAPLSAFLVLRGIATLGLRMDRHAATSLALARWLEGQPGIERVLHPGLTSHPQHELASRQLAAAGGMFALELAGGRAAGEAFVDALEVAERTASLGSVHTIVAHPPSTTHRQLSADELLAAGIGPGLLRVSVGLEDLDDLRADLARGLAAVQATTASDAVGAGA